jgi:hypothetical protein
MLSTHVRLPYVSLMTFMGLRQLGRSASHARRQFFELADIAAKQSEVEYEEATDRAKDYLVSRWGSVGGPSVTRERDECRC